MEKSANAHIEIPKVGKVITVQIVTMLVAVISLMIDGVMTSIYLGDDCTAAYGLTNPVNMLLVAVGGLLASGVQILGGRYAGRKNLDGLNRVLVTSVVTGFAGGLAVSVLISLFIHPVSRALGAKCPDQESIGCMS